MPEREFRHQGRVPVDDRYVVTASELGAPHLDFEMWDSAYCNIGIPAILCFHSAGPVL
jgi:hypothetical protein